MTTPAPPLPPWHPNREAYDPRAHRNECMFCIAMESGGALPVVFETVRQADRMLMRLQHKAALRRMISLSGKDGAA